MADNMLSTFINCIWSSLKFKVSLELECLLFLIKYFHSNVCSNYFMTKIVGEYSWYYNIFYQHLIFDSDEYL